VIDLHSHVLHGLDDGASDIDASLAILRAMMEDGVQIVCCTPHVRDDYPTTATAMENALASLRSAVAREGLAIEVRGGGEIAIDRLSLLADEERVRFGLGGNPSLLLIESPYTIWPADFPRVCAWLRHEGVVPVVAHPERNPLVQEDPSRLEDIVRAGAFVQLTAGSVDGTLGRPAAACSRRLLGMELAHLIASDAHGPGVREAGISAARDAVGGELGEWLTELVPAALLEGADLPRRPSRRRRRGLAGRLRGLGRGRGRSGDRALRLWGNRGQ